MVDDQNQSNRQMNCMDNVPQNCPSTFRMEDFGFSFPSSFPCIDCSSQTQPFPMMPQGFVLLQPPPPAPPKPAPAPPPPPAQQPACASLCPMCAQIASRLLSAGTGSSTPPRSCPLFSRRSEHPMFCSSLPQAHGHDCECMRCTLPSKRADSALFKCPVGSSAKSSRDQKYFNELNDMLDEKIDKILKPVLMTLAKVLPAQQPAPTTTTTTPEKSIKTCSCSSLGSFYKPGFCIPSKVYIDSESDSDDDEDYRKMTRQRPPQRKPRVFEPKTSKFKHDEDDDYQDKRKFKSKTPLESEKRTKSNGSTISKDKRDVLNEGMINLSATSIDSEDSTSSNNRNCTTNKCNKKNVSFNKRKQTGFKTDKDKDSDLKKDLSNSSTNLLLMKRR